MFLKCWLLGYAADSPDKADSVEMIDLTESDDDTDSVRSRPSSAFGVEYIPLPEYAKTLSMFSSTTSEEYNSELRYWMAALIVVLKLHCHVFQCLCGGLFNLWDTITHNTETC